MGSDKVNPLPTLRALLRRSNIQIRSGKFWDELTGAGKEALDQIATAIARIVVAGDGAHWDSIIGFAQAAKHGADEPTIAKDPMRSQVEGMRAIERAVREIPARNEY